MVSAYDVNGWPANFWTATPARQDRHDAMLAVLDAVIQLHAEISVSDGAKLYPEFPGHSLILLSRAGRDADSFLLEIFRNDRKQRAGWLAAGNLLVDNRVPGFAAAVLGVMTVHAKIIVLPSDMSGYAEGWAGDGASTIPEDKAGWPAIGAYTLLMCYSPDAGETLLLAGGTNPVVYRRTVSAFYKADPEYSCSSSGPPDTTSPDAIREEYLIKDICINSLTGSKRERAGMEEGTDDVGMAAQSADGQANAFLQHVEVGRAQAAQRMLFQPRPKPFIGVEFRGVGRESKHA